jgi:NitT/TauT family transport system permease protein
MKERLKRGALRAFEKSLVIFLILLAWWVLPLYFPNLFLPSLRDVLLTLVKMTMDGEIVKHTLGSLERAAVGLLLAEVLAIPLGILLGWFPRVERYLDPLFVALRNLSVLAILPLFVLFLGIGEVSKIAVISFGCFFPQLINTIEGVKNVDPILVKAARSMGLSPFGIFIKVVLPGSMSYIIAGFRLCASISLLILVGAEMLGAEYGLGYMIYHYQQAYMIPKMYAGIIIMVLIGVLVNGLIAKLEKRLTIWQEKPNT